MGTPKAARLSSITFGDKTLTPFNSDNGPNIRTVEGVLDVDWFTDLKGFAAGWDPVVYPVAKIVWVVTRTAGHLTGYNFPFQDPGERKALELSMLGYGYSDIFTPSYMAQVCGR